MLELNVRDVYLLPGAYVAFEILVFCELTYAFLLTDLPRIWEVISQVRGFEYTLKSC